MSIYDIVADRIIGRIETAEKSGEKFYWVKPFAHGAVSYPCCYETGEPYKGINRVLLEPDEFTTYAKIQQHNERHPNEPLFIRKGSKTSIAVYFGHQVAVDKNGEVQTDEKGNPIKKPFVRYYNLFSRQDIVDKKGKNVPSKFPVKHYDHNEISAISQDEFLKFCSMVNKYCEANGIEIQIINDGTQCYYSPDENVVRLPVLSNFESVYEHCSAVAHELCHATGKELDRFHKVPKTVEAYSKEELIAEIGAEMLLSNFKIEDDRTNKNNDIAYLQSWAKHLKDKPKQLVYAAQKAQKAVELITKYMEKEPSLDDMLLSLKFKGDDTSNINKYDFEEIIDEER